VKFFHSLSFRVLGISFLLLVGLVSLYTYFTINFHQSQMMDYVFQSASRLSDVIKNSTHYSMMLNRKEDVYQTITMIGKEPGVEGIRIYNKRGEIMFSTNESEKGSIVDLHAEACYGCHEQEKPLQSLPMNNRMRIYTSQGGPRILGLINPIKNEPGCITGNCHAHPHDKTVLGVLDVRMSLDQVDKAISQAKLQMIGYATLTIIILAITSILFLVRIVHLPVQILINGTKEISSGNLTHQIPITSKDELGILAKSFNSMTESIRNLMDENQRWSRELEHRVEEKTTELRQIHEQILQIEKMASLGKLSATVAHELNNPLEGILTYSKLIVKRIRKQEQSNDALKSSLEELELIIRETERCGNIVKNLLLFSRKQVGEFALVSIRTIIEKSAQLMQHHFQISNVKFDVVEKSEDIAIMCDENQIEQALVALFVNSVEAMPDGGRLMIMISRDQRTYFPQIRLMDSGCGIPAEKIPNIFEPFYSTKKEGHSVGLGLSVVYGIIERHGGKIEVESMLGKGTTFIITFPPAHSIEKPIGYCNT
jgi:two-component system NtrC family sensor kinase